MSFDIPVKKQRTIDDEIQVARQREARMQHKYLDFKHRQEMQKSVTDKLVNIQQIDTDIMNEQNRQHAMVSKIRQLELQVRKLKPGDPLWS